MKHKDVENLKNLLKTNDLLRNGFGPAHNSDKLYVAIPGIIKYDGYFGTDVYYALVIEKSENGAKPVDWYSWARRSSDESKPDFVGGFGGWYKYDYDTFIKHNPWVKEIWDSLDEEIKAVFEKKI